ncbi:putative Amino acid permease [Leptomonas pyrrhocoris]|uniref:Putative Amino acid permease n=1 Tax=Leptomonas pyrrhocoris TaxID=157538 RepID=A0A0M9FVY8_LEPPY|nr:putative Amino acid permease [Leptomonas pyrrhocoris]KPA77185.1 putative Amino acid permease [Leptomonas pyrrhocoris]|eukprot:XP_015655624.1 putative Amino acid permease [Leptomonas pyrrhocoris]
MHHVRERGAASAREGGDATSSSVDIATQPSSKAVGMNDVVSGVPKHQSEPTALPESGAGLPGGPAGVRARRHVEVLFHPELRRTKEVIRRPEWVRRTGEAVAHRGSLNTIALFGLVFANCVGGGYGFEDGIGAAGPLITLIVCILLPWIWALPTGLAVAELSTAVPSNSGVLMWTNAAFPPFISFMCILATIFITFIGNATYPNLTAQYAEQLGHLSAGPVAAVKIGVVVFCCALNCVGVEIVGSSSIVLCGITILPFSLLTVIQLFGHGFNKAVLYVDVRKVDWAAFFSIISWNYANIENAGAVVEEVANPRSALPKAMIMLQFSTYVAYVMPMLAGVSAMGLNQDYSQWKAGHWPDVAKVIAGDWLKYMLFSGALLSGVGFTLTSMCCTSRLLAGMGTMQMFPKKVSRIIGYYHPRLGTPIPAIVINSTLTLVFSVSMDFTSVVALCQSIYCIRMLLIYAALVKLRIEYPNLPRPYALPCGTWMAALCLLPAALFSLMASIVSAMSSLAIGIALVCFVVGGSGLSWVYCRIFARNGFQGVIVQCEVSSDEDGDGGGGGGGAASAEDGTLSEGVFYHDDDASVDEDGGGDFLLGILPAATASPTSATQNPNGGLTMYSSGPPQVYLRRGATDLDAVGPGEEVRDVEYTNHEVPLDTSAVGFSTNHSNSVSNVNLSNAASKSPSGFGQSSFPVFAGSLNRGPALRHRHRTRSLGASQNVVSGEDSAEEGEHTAGEWVTRPAGYVTPLADFGGHGNRSGSASFTTSPTPQLSAGGFDVPPGLPPLPATRDRSRGATPTGGRRSPLPHGGSQGAKKPSDDF